MEQRILLSAEPLVSLATIGSMLDTSRISGVTVITHGFQPSNGAGDALLGLGRAIVNFERDRDGQPGDTAWLLDYDVPGQGGTGGFDLRGMDVSGSSFFLPGINDASSIAGELVLLFDWASESNESMPGWTEAAGDALFAMLAGLGLVDPDEPTASKPLHFIAHSFGAAVTSEAVERLAFFGIPVDHVTLLDPHDFDQRFLPVDGAQAQSLLGLPNGYGATKWANVSFMDVYFQTRGEAEIDSFVPLGRPIPGAYNVLLDRELPALGAYSDWDLSIDGSGDHTFPWSHFYAGTVPGAYRIVGGFYEQIEDIDNDGKTGADDRLSNGVDRENAPIGFAFSRLRGGQSLRPLPDFYGLAEPNGPGADPRAGHDYTIDSLKPRQAGPVGRPEPRGGASPVWTPFSGEGVLVNGRLEPSSGSLIPGWTHHSGSGIAQAAGGALTLNLATPSRTHNAFYLPGSATHLVFDLSAVQDALDSNDVTLRVVLGEPGSGPQTVLKTLTRSELLAPSRSLSIPLLDASLQDRTRTLRFELGGPIGSARVTIDNVRFAALASGRSSDVIWLDLDVLLRADGRPVPSVFDIAQLGIDDGRLVRVKADEYRVEKRAGNVWSTAGTLLLAERFGRPAFAQSGQAAFVPYTPGRPGGGAQPAFEGSLTLRWDARALSRLDVSPMAHQALPGNRVSGSGDALDTARIQQRLRSLGYTGVSGGALVVDGVMGPNTRHAIGQLNAAARQQTGGAPSANVDRNWINDTRAPTAGTLAPERRLSSQEQQALKDTSDYVRQWIGAARAAPRAAPAPLAQEGDVAPLDGEANPASLEPAWSQSIPLLQGDLGGLLPLGEVMSRLVADVLSSLPDAEDLTTEALEAALRETLFAVELPTVGSGGNPAVQSFEFSLVSGAPLRVVATASGLRLQGLVLQASSSTSARLDLGAAAAALGVALTGVNELTLARTLSFGLDLEILADPTLALAQSLRVHDLWVEGRLSTAAPDIDASYRSGSLEGRLVDGRIDRLEVSLRSGLVSDARGRSLADLAARPLAESFDLGTPQLRLQATLPLELATGVAGTLATTKVIDYTGALGAPVIDWGSLRFGGLGFGDLGGIDTSDFVDALTQLRDWFDALGGNAGAGGALGIDWPELKLPQLGSLQLPNLGDLLRLGNWLKLPDLSPPGGGSLPSIDLPSWREIVAAIPGFQAGSLAFDLASRTLSVRVSIDEILGSYLTTLSLGEDRVVAPITLTASTLLADLNGGLGVADLGASDPTTRITLRDGQAFSFNLAGATTLGDVIARIETASRRVPTDASTARVEVRLGPSADRLLLRDLTTGTGTFAASALPNLQSPDPLDTWGSAEPYIGLGLVGADTDGDGTLQGEALVGGVGTPVQARARLAGSFTLGVDLSPLGSAWGTLETGTLLTQLNGGSGVAAAATGANAKDVAIFFADGSTVQVSLAGITDVAGLIDRLQADSGGRLQVGVRFAQLGLAANAVDPSVAAIAGDTARLWLRDLTFGTAGATAQFRIEAVGSSLRGAGLVGLGILGLDDDGPSGAGDGVIAGTPLHGDSIARHVFLRFGANDGLQASVELAAPQIDARVDIGGLTLGVQDGAAALRGAIDLKFSDPGERGALISQDGSGVRTFAPRDGSLDGRISLAELLGTFGDARDRVRYSPTEASSRLDRLVGDVALEGHARVELPLVAQPAALLAPDAQIRLDWTDLTDPDTLSVQARGLDLVQGLKNLAFAELIGHLRRVGQGIRELESTALFQQELPLLGDDLAALVKLADRFDRFVDELERHPAQTVEQLRAAIAAALAVLGSTEGESADSSTSYDGKLIRTRIAFGTQGQRELPLDLDLGNLGQLAGVDGLSGTLLSASGRLMLGWQGGIAIELEIDASDPLDPVVYVRDGTQATFGLGLFGADFDASASFGPLGLFVRDGTFRLDNGQPILDGAGDTSIDFSRLARWTAQLDPDDGISRYQLGGDFGFEDFVTSAVGAFDANLPVRFPDEQSPLDPQKPSLVLRIADLAHPGQSTSVTVPSLAAAQAAIGNFTDSLNSVWNALDEGWLAAFDRLAEMLEAGVLNAPLPLVGQQLKDAAEFIGDLREALAPVLRGSTGEKTQALLLAKLHEALSPWLTDANGNGLIDSGDISVLSSGVDRIEFMLPLAQARRLLTSDIGFDLGLPGLGLQVDGSVQAELGFEWNLGIGLSKDEGFYLVLPPGVADDLRIGLEVTIPGFDAIGELGFLQVRVRDDAANASRLFGEFTVDLRDPSGDNRLTLSDLTGGSSLSQLVGATFGGSADINLKIESSIEGNTAFPRVRADLGIDWAFGNASTTDALFGSAPQITFDNVQFNAGDFVNGVLGPTLRNVDQVLAPVRPAIEFLTSPVPGLSAILPNATLLSLARPFAPAEVARVEKFVNEFRAIDRLVSQISAIGGNGWIALGNTNGADLVLDVAASDPRKAGNKPREGATAVVSKQEMQSRLAATSAGAAMNNAGAQAGFTFPAFEEPSKLLGLLFGRNVKLIEYKSPVLGDDLRFTLAEFPLPILPVILVRIEALLGVAAQFTMGFDTEGIRRYSVSDDPADLLDGFYIQDTVDGTPATADIAEIRVYGGVGVFLALPRLRISANFGFIAGGLDIDIYGGGGVRARLDFNLNDPNRDGVVRADELASNLVSGPEYLFDISGGVDFFLQARALVRAWVEVNLWLAKVRRSWTVIDWSYDQSIPILSFGGTRSSNPPVLAHLEGDTLVVHSGPQAQRRGNGDTADGNENFRISGGDAAGTVLVSAFGLQQSFAGVRVVKIDGGLGNDTIQIAANLRVERVEASGGDGDDTLANESAVAVVFRGGAGKDRLQGGSGADLLDGGDGDDQLSGGDGDDRLEGGLGNDRLAGGSGNDVLVGGPASGSGSDDDMLSGDGGDDSLDGGIGNDNLAGGAGRDLLQGGAGNDALDGGRDADRLFGGAGNDGLAGGDGADELHGDDGDDFLQGGRGADALYGGAGADTLWGGLDADTVDGGAGDDILYGGEDLANTALKDVRRWGADTLIGGLGDDALYAGAGPGPTANGEAQRTLMYGDNPAATALDGNDTIWGDLGIDEVYGGGGSDVIRTFAGDDRIDAGAGDDRVDAGSGDDLLVGGAGADELEGGAGRDLIWGGAALVALDPVLLARGNVAGQPPLLGLPDFIAGEADMAAFAAGSRLIVPLAVAGRSMRDDAADAGDGADRITGGSERDWIFGGGGNDSVSGGGGEDYIDGGAGNDTLLGDAEADVIRGGDEHDEIRGGDGADLLYGDSGRDTLYGDRADALAPTADNERRRQRLWGGADEDVLIGWSGPASNVTAAAAEAAFMGDALDGGDGRDLLYGGLRQDVLDGGAGNDVLRGDAVAANLELTYEQLRVWGAADRLLGGAGEDVLQGGGGDDELRGGAGDDRLEGQNGADRLFGEAGADVLVVDLDAAYGAGTVDRFDGHGDPATLDGGTDRVLVVGTAGDDTIEVAETVPANGQPALLWVRSSRVADPVRVDWRDAAVGFAPRLEQIHVQGLDGNDRLGFLRAGDSLPAGVGPLDVAALALRSREWVGVIDGGDGNDILLGSEGRDYLDGGIGSDEVYGFGGDDSLWGDDGRLALAGNSDADRIYGGQGNDDLYGGRGRNELFAWSGNPYRRDALGRYVDSQDNPLANQTDPNLRVWLGPASVAGLLGVEDTGINRVLGGVGADLLYGGSGLDFLYGGEGENLIIGRSGQPLDSADGGGFAGDEWKTYARQTDRIWYYGGSNADDTIQINKVTESGPFEGRHLITRLTRNADNASFDAQVRLTIRGNAAASPTWDLASTIDSRALGNGLDVDALSAQMGSDTLTLDLASRVAALLPPEDDYMAILVDALAGNDTVIVGPTTDRVVWVDAGAGDDVVRVESGTAIVTDNTENVGLPGKPIRKLPGEAYTLTSSPAATSITGNLRLIGLTLSTPEDEDWFVFRLDAATAAGAEITGLSLSAQDGLSIELYAATRDAQGRIVAPAGAPLRAAGQASDRTVRVAAAGLPAGEYLLRVRDDLRPTRYTLTITPFAGQPETTLGLGAAPGKAPADVLIGGSGNDVLQGGRGEDWLFGGDGNDVLTGGLDRQAPDLLLGGAGDDTFQILPDALFDPDDDLGLTNGPLPPVSEPGLRFDDLMRGGAGTDRVLYLGGDVDSRQRGIDDHATIRFNVEKQRYEFAARVWDAANQRFVTKSGGAADAFELGYAFFRIEQIESIEAELRGGNDEFHAEPGYRMAGDASPARVWGLDGGTVTAGAPLSGVVVSGGAGADILVGGAGRDRLAGNDGDDFIVGGSGDDDIDGGSGDDDLFGGAAGELPFDRFEWVTRGGTLQANDNPTHAADIQAALQRTANGPARLEAVFHSGDDYDWYLLRVSDSVKASNDANAIRNAVRSAVQAGGERFDVFMAEVQTEPDGTVRSVRAVVNPVDKSFVLLRVASVPKAAGSIAVAAYSPSLLTIATLTGGDHVAIRGFADNSSQFAPVLISGVDGSIRATGSARYSFDGFAPSIAPLPDGGFLIAWRDAGYNLLAQSFAADGSSNWSQPVTLRTGSVAARPGIGAAVALLDGSVVVLWKEAFELGSALKASRFDPGSAAPTVLTLDGTAVGNDLFGRPSASLVALDNGGFAVAWQAGTLTKYQRYDRLGNAAGAQADLRQLGLPAGLPLMQANRDATISLLYEDSALGVRQVFVRSIDINGNGIGVAQVVSGYNSFQGFAGFVALADGRSLVAWRDFSVATGTVVFGRLLDASGRPVGETFSMPGETSSSSSNSIAARAGDGFVVLRRTVPNVAEGWTLDRYATAPRSYAVSIDPAVLAPAPPAAPAAPSGFTLAPRSQTVPAVSAAPSWQGNALGLGLRTHFEYAGTVSSIELSPIQRIDDFNGDGIAELLVSDEYFSYLYFDPAAFGGTQDLASTANLVFARSQFGLPAERMGDLNGDGLTDLAFFRGGTVHVFFGGANYEREPLRSGWSNSLGLVGGLYGKIFVANWDGSGADELIVASGDTFSRRAIVGVVGSNNTFTQTFEVAASSSAGYPSGVFDSLVIDVNGDGRDDLLMAAGSRFFGVFGGRTGSIDANTASNFVWRQNNPNTNRTNLFALGDIDRDGFEDFAVAHNGGTYFVGEPATVPQLQIVRGSASLPASATAIPTAFGIDLPISDLTTAYSDAQFVALSTRYSVSAGDFDADGRVDLAIGRLLQNVSVTDYSFFTTTVENDLTGRVFVFDGIMDRAPTLTFGDASRSFAGSDSGGLYGVLPATPSYDIDGDGQDDLLVAAPLASNFSGASFVRGGTMARAPIERAAVALPAAPTLLANDAERTALVRTSMLEGATRFEAQSLAGGTAWYRFQLRGAGTAAGNESIIAELQQRLVQTNGQWGLAPVPLALDLYDAAGKLLRGGERVVSLVGLGAGEYYLRARALAGFAADARFDLEVLPPVLGQALEARDRDIVRGGAGNDRLGGGGDLDQLRGDTGVDVIVGEAGEFGDREPRDALLRLPLLSPDRIAARTADPADPLVVAAGAGPVLRVPDAELMKALREAAGVAASLPLRRSDLAAITRLDLSGRAIASLEGLQHLVNLEELYLDDMPAFAGVNGWTRDLSPVLNLKRLRVLSAENSAITSLGSIAGLKSLEVLDLSGNQIRNLSALTSSWVVDDDRGGVQTNYGETGPNWMLGRQAPAVGGDFRFADGNLPGTAHTATWALPATLAAGTYRLEVTLPHLPYESGTQSYSVQQGVNTTLLPATAVSRSGFGPGPGGERPWKSVGTFSVGSDGGGITIRATSSTGDTIADAVRIVRLDGAGQPAGSVAQLERLKVLDLGNNPVSLDDLAVFRPAIEARLAANAARDGITATVNLPAAATAPNLTTPDFINISGWSMPSQGFGRVFMPVQSGTELSATGAIAAVTADRRSVDYIQFRVVTGGQFLIDVDSASLAGETRMRDPILRLFAGAAGSSSPREITALVSGSLDDENFSLGLTDPRAVVALEPGVYSLALSTFGLSTDEAKADNNTLGSASDFLNPNGSGGAAFGRYGLVVRSVDGNPGRLASVSTASAFGTVQTTVAWSSGGVSANLGGNLLEVLPYLGTPPRSSELGLRATAGTGTSIETSRLIVTDASRVGTNRHVYGTVYADTDSSRTRQDSEVGVERVWVGIDTNGDGSLADEAIKVGAWTDYRGRYVIDLGAFGAAVPATAQILVREPAGTGALPLLPSSEPDRLGGLRVDDIVGPRDIALSTWGSGVPSDARVNDGQPLALRAPASVVVQAGSGPNRSFVSRSDLDYSWHVFAAGAELVDANRLFRQAGNSFDPVLSAQVANGQYVVVLAAHDTAVVPVAQQTLANALVKTQTRITVDPVVRTVERGIVPLVEGGRLVVDARTLLPAYTVMPDPAELTFTRTPGTNGLVITGTGYVGQSAVLASGSLAFDTTLGRNGTPWLRVRGTAAVANAAPSVVFASPGPLFEGSAVSIEPTVADPGGDTLAFAWSVTRQGQAGTVAVGQTRAVQFTAVQHGTYTITYTATDAPSEGNNALPTTVPFNLTVQNVAPGALALAAAGNQQGRPVTVSVSFTDPGAADTHTFTWSVRDPLGNLLVAPVTGSQPSFGFVPLLIGDHTVNVTVIDEDGGSATASLLLPVLNAAPELALVVPDSVDPATRPLEGQPIVAEAIAVDADPALTFAWQLLRNGVALPIGATGGSGNARTFTFTPPDDGSYELRVTATDSAGASTTRSGTILVANRAPAGVAIVQLGAQGQPLPGGGEVTVLEGSALRLRADGSDVPADGLTSRWALFGPGGELLASHTGAEWSPQQTLDTLGLGPLQPGRYRVRLETSDDDGAAAPAVERVLVITDAVPAWFTGFADVTGLVLGAARVDRSFEIVSPGGAADRLRAEIDWGDGVVEGIALDKAVSGRWVGNYRHEYTTRPANGSFHAAVVRVRDDEGTVLEAGFRSFVADGPRLEVLLGGNPVQRDGPPPQLGELTEGLASSVLSYRIQLSAAPTAAVTIDFVTDEQVQLWDRAPGSPGAQPLTRFVIGPADWQQVRTVFVTARDDKVDEPNQRPSTIRHVVSTTDERVLAQLRLGDGWLPALGVTTVDDDSAGLVVRQLESRTTERGGTARFTVALNSQPLGEVVIDLVSSNTGEGTLSANALRFNSQNWDQAQTVVVTGRGDRGATPTDDAYEVRFAAVSGAPGYAGLSRPALGFVNLDDGTAMSIVAVTPALDGESVDIDADIAIVFNQNLSLGSGTLVLRNAAGGVVETFVVGSGNRVRVAGNTLTIDPSAALAYGTGYTLTLQAGAVRDAAGNPFAGGVVARFETFDILRYIASYADLMQAFGTNVAAATVHYEQWGKAEGRGVSFDPLRYTASYGDLIQAHGSDTRAATTHYILFGYAEGRTATFDTPRYLASHDDLLADFGSNLRRAARHYIEWGFAEGRGLTFDALRYVASYGDLIRDFGLDAAGATLHYVRNGFAEGRRASFDALAYIASYGDLMGVFRLDAAGATVHYIRYGFAEGRRASFDGLSYIATYGDLIRDFGLDAARGVVHFITNGFAEGRSIAFDGLRYTASYGDLIPLFGLDRTRAVTHYIQYGFGEGRSASFDALRYVASNGDLVTAIGADILRATQHYISAGFFENRLTQRFDAAIYLANYADLQAAFGQDLTAATLHYLRNGFFEGRVGDRLLARPAPQMSAQSGTDASSIRWAAGEAAAAARPANHALESGRRRLWLARALAGSPAVPERADRAVVDWSAAPAPGDRVMPVLSRIGSPPTRSL